MSLFDFFFPEEAQASHLRRLADQQQRAFRRNAHTNRAAEENGYRIAELEDRVMDLERDLGFVSLLLGSLLDAMEKDGTVSRRDVRAAMSELDGHDGYNDDRLDIDALRNWRRRRRRG